MRPISTRQAPRSGHQPQGRVLEYDHNLDAIGQSFESENGQREPWQTADGALQTQITTVLAFIYYLVVQLWKAQAQHCVQSTRPQLDSDFISSQYSDNGSESSSEALRNSKALIAKPNLSLASRASSDYDLVPAQQAQPSPFSSRMSDSNRYPPQGGPRDQQPNNSTGVSEILKVWMGHPDFKLGQAYMGLEVRDGARAFQGEVISKDNFNNLYGNTVVSGPGSVLVQGNYSRSDMAEITGKQPSQSGNRLGSGQDGRGQMVTQTSTGDIRSLLQEAERRRLAKGEVVIKEQAPRIKDEHMYTSTIWVGNLRP